MTEGRSEMRWGRRVPKWKIRRLYEADASGIVDEELLDDVGITLLVRCRDIVAVREAREGKVKCHRCARQRRHTIIVREQGLKGDPRDEVLVCPVCGWTITWGEYHKSLKRKQLNSGGATTAFETFVRRYPSARTPQQKMLAIDQLIHEFHYAFRDRPDFPTRPVGVNLIEGRLSDVVPFLDELSYGKGIPREADANRQAWRATLDEMRERDWLPVRLAPAHGMGRKTEVATTNLGTDPDTNH